MMLKPWNALNVRETMRKREAGTFAPLEIAHILQHSLMNVGSGGEGSWYVHLYVGIHSVLVLIESTVGFATILPQLVAM